MTERTGRDIRPAAFCHDFGHRWVVAGEPIGRTEAVADLRRGEFAGATGKSLRSVVRRRLRAAACTASTGCRGRGGSRWRKAVSPGRGIGSERCGGKRNEYGCEFKVHLCSLCKQLGKPVYRKTLPNARGSVSSGVATQCLVVGSRKWLDNSRALSGADPLVRGRHPRRPFAV